MHPESFGKFRGKVVNMKRFIMTTLVVLSAISAIFASTYIIDRYDFNFEGKTDVNEVYKFLGLSDGASFSSYEELQSHVIAKTQKLVNERIFTSVDYDIVEGDVVVTTPGDETANEYHYVAVYYVNDRSPFFIFPTPKYDSNYGAKIGLRIDSKNFGGKLAKFEINTDMKQNDHSFKKAEYGLDFNILGYPIASSKLDTTLSFKYDGRTGGLNGTTLGLSSKLSGIKVANFKMDASASISFKGLENYTGSELSLSTYFYDIKLGDTVGFSLSSGIKFTPTKNDLSSIGCNEFTYTASLSNLFSSIGGVSLSHKLTYAPRSKKTTTNNSLSYYGLSLRGKTISTSLGLDTAKVADNPQMTITASGTASMSFGLPLGMTLSPSLRLYKTYTTDGTWDMSAWPVNKRITASATLSRSTLNVVLDGNSDFRKGMSLSVVASRDMSLMNLLKDPAQYVQMQFTWFPYANSWFNPSIRINGSIASSASRAPVPSASTTYIADYMRGIKDDNTYSAQSWNTKVVANVNLTSKCINLGSWARTYAIAFTDIAMLHNKNAEVKMLYTVGIEGIGIINDHPNYPVRASLGFNTESIKKYAETKNFKDLEYELFFGLYYFY